MDSCFSELVNRSVRRVLCRPIFLSVVVTLGPLMVGGCAVPQGIQIATWAIDGLSYVVTKKSITDHGISMVAGKDCAVFKVVTKGHLCDDYGFANNNKGVSAPDKAVDSVKSQPLRHQETKFEVSKDFRKLSPVDLGVNESGATNNRSLVVRKKLQRHHFDRYPSRLLLSNIDKRLHRIRAFEEIEDVKIIKLWESQASSAALIRHASSVTDNTKKVEISPGFSLNNKKRLAVADVNFEANGLPEAEEVIRIWSGGPIVKFNIKDPSEGFSTSPSFLGKLKKDASIRGSSKNMVRYQLKSYFTGSIYPKLILNK